jgi:hypothetical protein
VAGIQFFVIRQQSEREGRAGECQCKRDHQCRLPGRADQPKQQCQHRCGGRHLCTAGAKDGEPQRPQATRLQLKADDEQQEDDADLGEVQHVSGIADQCQAPRPHQHPGTDKGEH